MANINFVYSSRAPTSYCNINFWGGTILDEDIVQEMSF